MKFHDSSDFIGIIYYHFKIKPMKSVWNYSVTMNLQHYLNQCTKRPNHEKHWDKIINECFKSIHSWMKHKLFFIKSSFSKLNSYFMIEHWRKYHTKPRPWNAPMKRTHGINKWFLLRHQQCLTVEQFCLPSTESMAGSPCIGMPG